MLASSVTELGSVAELESVNTVKEVWEKKRVMLTFHVGIRERVG